MLNNQFNKIREVLFEQSFKKGTNQLKEELNEILNNIITEYEFKSKRVLTYKQKLKGKILILEQEIIPIITDPMQKSIAYNLQTDYKNKLGE